MNSAAKRVAEMLEQIFSEQNNDVDKQAVVTAAYGWSIAKAGQGKKNDNEYVGPGGSGSQIR